MTNSSGHTVSSGPGGMADPLYFLRFNLSQRLEHLVLMVSFTALVVTGLPQKFYGEGWAQAIILALGGIEITRLLHRSFGLVFLLLALYHVALVTYGVLMKKGSLSMVPSLKDTRDAIAMVRYGLGLAKEKPQFDRYDYRQKFEYWGIVFGGLGMIVSGIILVYPAQVTQLLPGQFIPAAKELHSNEALLAFLTIVIWHLYGAHFGPGRFPFDATIFTGKTTQEKMLDEHPLEYRRLVSSEPSQATPAEARPARAGGSQESRPG